MLLHVRKSNRRIPLYWVVGTRPGAHCRLRGGLFLPICEPSALLQAAYAMICHLTCLSAASICVWIVWKPPPVKYVRVTMLNPRVPAIQARLPRQNVPRLQLIFMMWLWHAYDELGARHVTRRPWQLLRATRVIVRTPFPVGYGCADRDWPAIGVYHTRAHLQSHRQCWCSVCKGRFHSLECPHRLRATAIGISLLSQLFADRRTPKQFFEMRGSSGTCQRRDPATAAPQCCIRLPASSISKARRVLRSRKGARMRKYARALKIVVSDDEQMGHTCNVVVLLPQRRCTDGSYVRHGLGADS
jgi:hypothetical protein